VMSDLADPVWPRCSDPSDPRFPPAGPATLASNADSIMEFSMGRWSR
jgi:hypothetical protein